MDPSLSTVRAFEQVVSKQVPSFKIGYKDQSFSQKLIGFLFPMNSSYMTNFVTTFYPTVYVPTKAWYESNPRTSFLLLAHEMTHLMDTVKHPFWFRFSYAFPQFAAVLPLIAFAVMAGKSSWILPLILGMYILGCVFAKKNLALFYVCALGGIIAGGVLAILLCHWWSALLFGGLALAAPWPAPGRTHWEMRGYAMNLAVTQWAYGSVPEFYRQSIVSYFTGPGYYFMDWAGKSATQQVDDICTSAANGTLQTEAPYSVVYDFMAANGLLKS